MPSVCLHFELVMVKGWDQLQGWDSVDQRLDEHKVSGFCLFFN